MADTNDQQLEELLKSAWERDRERLQREREAPLRDFSPERKWIGVVKGEDTG